MNLKRGIYVFLSLLIFLIVFLCAVFVFYFLSANRTDMKISADSGNKTALSASLSGNVLQATQDRKFPYVDSSAPDLSVGAESAVSYDMGPNGEKVLFEKNSDEKLPIASISKLMSALVILENYDLSQKVVISPAAASQPDENLQFKAGEQYFAKDLLHFMLVSSSNEACYALSEVVGTNKFVDLMNAKAEEIGLNDTLFSNPTGLYLSNFSTVKDLAKLADYIFKNEPLIFEMTTSKSFSLNDVSGIFMHESASTDELLFDPALAGNIIGGKTGDTPYAEQCLLMVLKTPDADNHIINVILKSDDRFGDMRKIINWENKALIWQ